MISLNPRDIAQRTMGWVGFSAIAHAILLIALLLTSKTSGDPKEVNRSAEAAAGKSEPVEVVMANTAQAPTESDVTVQAPPQPVAVTTPVSPVEVKKEEIALPPSARKPVVKKTAAKVAKKSPAPEKAKLADESSPIVAKQLEDFQPNSIPETDEKKAELETLSPVIAEDVDAKDEPKAEEAKPEPVAEEPAAAPPIAVAAAEPPRAIEKSIEAAPATAPKASSPGPAAGEPANGGGGSGIEGKGHGQKIMDASLRQPMAGNPLPQYPEQDRLLRREGLAVVTGDVGRDGGVENVRLERSSGSSQMDASAISAFKKWRFAPGPEATVRKSFQYALQGEAQVGYAKLKR